MTNVKDIGSVPIGPLVSVFLFMSAVAHLLVVSPVYFETYCDDIRRGINRARWYEYALSSGLMIRIDRDALRLPRSSVLTPHTGRKCVHEPVSGCSWRF